MAARRDSGSPSPAVETIPDGKWFGQCHGTVGSKFGSSSDVNIASIRMNENPDRQVKTSKKIGNLLNIIAARLDEQENNMKNKHNELRKNFETQMSQMKREMVNNQKATTELIKMLDEKVGNLR